MEKIKLKPCPFCGGGAAIGRHGDNYFAECCKCGSRTWFYKSAQKVAEAWNRRYEKMDAVEFFKEAKRMCRVLDCEKCPFRGEECGLIGADNFEERIAAVEKWAAEHPVKTRQSEFLRMFPNADIDKDGVLIAIPCHIDKNMRKVYCQALNGCVECRKAYWLAEVE